MSSTFGPPPDPQTTDAGVQPEGTLTRRRFAGVAGATLAAGVAPGGAQAFAASGRGPKARPWRRPQPPRLPAGFDRTFSSRFINANGLRQHAVIGGEGPPLLLVHGWPENWYAWRHLMPTLARDFQVIAVDQRGIGETEKPKDGYDTRSLANDLVALMDALGHKRFAMVGHDTGFIIGYALAADHPERVARIALVDLPGPPLSEHSPPLFAPEALNNKLWHIAANRVEGVTEQLVRGREDIYYGYEFAIQGGNVPKEVVEYYVRLVSTRENLRGSLALYRAWDETMTQNDERAKQPLTMPVLTIGGGASWGDLVGTSMKPLTTDLRSVVIPNTGHWVAEQSSDEMLAALAPFLAPYRGAAAPAPTARSRAAA